MNLTDRLKAERCEICDKTTQLPIHHMGTIRNTNRQRIIILRNRVIILIKNYKIYNYL
ncbi:hypothetical protein OC683_01870 ['Crotalaria aegyptiaca' phytoplasma]|uniref:Uncharacterized protein n=1 Tax=Candidatus Phytoplasma crotalariae TaxID=2982627 RepID=A0ABT9D3Y7_9MOLU|nr:hypothetical protein ['Crotalaria aegyptiaca' phytoplasma]MDO8059356.1 hypothetical protein ['Crotalaria aegyptiaca' phytoplasma]